MATSSLLRDLEAMDARRRAIRALNNIHDRVLDREGRCSVRAPRDRQVSSSGAASPDGAPVRHLRAVR